MLIAIYPLVFLILGLVVYFIASNAKVAEAGRLMYFVGLLWLVYGLVGKVLHIGAGSP